MVNTEAESTESRELIRINDLCVFFKNGKNEKQVLRGVNITLKKGEILALVGESGSGKSVTARAVMGLLEPCARATGSIIYNRKDILKLSQRELDFIRGGGISMVMQDPLSSLDPTMRVGAQITEVLRLKLKMRKSQAKQRAVELMQEAGINDAEKRFYKYPFELSGGLRQRVVIAMALAAYPDIIICDEPTTAQDVTVQSRILKTVDGIRKKRDVGVIFITHDLGVVASIADTVAVMYAGRVVEYGSVNDVFYFPAHPYTWGLIEAACRVPSTVIKNCDGISACEGDRFASRNRYALRIDFEKEPPMFKVGENHYAATWLAHKYAPKVEPPQIITQMRNKYFEKATGEQNGSASGEGS